MTEPKWTPGPWDYEWVPAKASGGGHLYIIDSAGRKIAAIWGKAEEKEFAARLIAAAPELYEAAVRALEEMCHTTAPRSSFTDAVDTLDAAITKARGEP
ncbi:MAG TPA: hypothetical protein VNH39_01185 [Steroidobacteraceae bacterium]|nr:hypothetical protein [Steroidobacteraceae bacterium]